MEDCVGYMCNAAVNTLKVSEQIQMDSAGFKCFGEAGIKSHEVLISEFAFILINSLFMAEQLLCKLLVANWESALCDLKILPDFVVKILNTLLPFF